jgi:hypothetical protein
VASCDKRVRPGYLGGGDTYLDNDHRKGVHIGLGGGLFPLNPYGPVGEGVDEEIPWIFRRVGRNIYGGKGLSSEMAG